MSAMLYLDTARLGQMSPTALKTHCDFVRLMAEDPSSLYTEQFLFDGANATPSIAQRFPELARWLGIEGFQNELRAAFAGRTDTNTEILLSSRTTNLMKLGVESLAGRKRLLITDLTWPPYRKWILKYAVRSGLAVTMLRLRKSVWQGMTAVDLTQIVLSALRRSGSDGLFLPAVTHTGIRLPLQNILRETATDAGVRTIIDASQAYGHVDTNEWSHLADFVFGGCHKWVRAYLPISVGFAKGFHRHQIRRSLVRDPLTHFCRSVATGTTGPMETVNLSPLFSAHGAISDLPSQKSNRADSLDVRIIQRMIQEHPHWQASQTHESLRSRMLMIQTRTDSLKQLSPQTLRAMMGRSSVSVTTYNGGHLRLSVPMSKMQPKEHRQLRTALRPSLRG